jgi:predicted acyltransferase
MVPRILAFGQLRYVHVARWKHFGLSFVGELVSVDQTLMNTPQDTDRTAPTERLMSVDALRGFDMFWILGADSLVYALNRMSQTAPTRFLATQLEHAEWEGFHFYDLIFPLFVFLVGVSIVFSLRRLLEHGGRAAALRRVFRRSALLFLIALIYSGGFSHSWPDIRLMGVLNRIALCYFFGGLIFCFVSVRAMIALASGLLLAYWALLAWVPFPDVRPMPGGEQVITKEAGFTNVAQLNFASTRMLRGSSVQGVNLTNYLDQKYLPGRKYDGTYDPEGLLSTIPAVVTCLLGIFAGLLLKNAALSAERKVICLLAIGSASVVLGFVWGLEFPVIKKIWSSSYVLVAGGFSFILLGIFYWVVDVRQYRKWCQPFVWIGMNSITVYLANNFTGGFVTRLAPRLAGGDVESFFDQHIAHGAGSLALSITGLLLAIWFVHFLYRRKIFLRL